MLVDMTHLSWWSFVAGLTKQIFAHLAVRLGDQVFAVDVRVSEIDDDDLATLVGVKAAVVGNGGA